MDIELLREYCLNKNNVEECFPFGEDTLVFKVNKKIFFLASLEKQPLAIYLKCEPQKAIELREMFDSITPGYHMNKKHWNTIVIEGTIKAKQVLEMIDDSYTLVAGKKSRLLD